MLTCIACSKQQLSNNNGGSKKREEEDEEEEERYGVISTTPKSKQGIKSLTSQIKDMAVKASGAYRSCKPCSGSSNRNQNRSYVDSESGRFRYEYKRAGGSGSSTPKILGKEMESKLKGLLSGEGTPESMSGRTESTVFMEEEEEDEPKEWVAQVEPGVLITFVSLPQGGNDLKRIRFSREMFEKWQAQKWWAENFDKVMELYNVQQFNQQSVPLPIPPRPEEDGSSRIQSTRNSPVTPPLNKECPRGKGNASSCSLAHKPIAKTQSRYHDSSSHATTPKLSSISGTKTATSSRSSREEEEEEEEEGEGEDQLSVSNASEMETEWVEQDEAGVYITIRALPDGTRELRRVRFSRDRFGETNARLWWEQNRVRIQQQYL